MQLEHVKGLAELSAALKKLPDRIARNALRQSVSQGAAVIRAEAKVRAPRAPRVLGKQHTPPGTLRRAIVTKHDVKRSNLTSQTYVVTVRSGKRYRNQGKKKNLSQDAYYWRWVEFGTVKMAAQPFLRPAFETKKSEAVNRIAKVLGDRIVEEAAKLPGAKR